MDYKHSLFSHEWKVWKKEEEEMTKCGKSTPDYKLVKYDTKIWLIKVCERLQSSWKTAALKSWLQ